MRGESRFRKHTPNEGVAERGWPEDGHGRAWKFAVGDSGTVMISLDLASRRSRWLFMGIVLAIVGPPSYAAAKVWLADLYSKSSDPKLWLRAARLEPGNSGYWMHLGLYKQLDPEAVDLPQATTYFERATDVNPLSDAAWMQLAGIHEAMGDPLAARQALQNAQANHPLSAGIAWRFGNFLLGQDDFAGAFVQIRRALVSDPSLTAAAVSQVWERGRSATEIADQVLPQQQSYLLIALDLFLSRGQTEAAGVVWDRLVRLGQPLQAAQAIPIVDALIEEQRIPEARRSWEQALRLLEWPQREPHAGELIFNGGFEADLLNGGFGWREAPQKEVHFSVDRDVSHTGRRSLRVTFDGTANLDFTGLSAYVPVEPLRRYRFSAYLRTDAISTENGVGFEITDLFRPGAFGVSTQKLVGTHPWTEVQADFETGAVTQVLKVTLRRVPTWKLDRNLAGTVWVDDVSLVTADQQARTEWR